MAALVTMAAAKAHLHIPLTTVDKDADILRKLEQASAVIIDYLKSRAVDGWSDGTVAVPGPVVSATLLLFTHLYEHRGDDDMKLDEALWQAIERLLVRSRDPALA